MYNVAFTGIVIVAIFNLVDLDQTSQNVLQAVGVLWGSFFCSFAFVLPRLLESRRDRRASNNNGHGDTSYPDSSVKASDMTNRGMLRNVDESYNDSTSVALQPVGLEESLRSKDPTMSPHRNKSNRTTSNDDNKNTTTPSSTTPKEQSTSVTPSSMYRTTITDVLSSIVYPSSIWEVTDDDDEAKPKEIAEAHILEDNNDEDEEEK
jgi:hypothetical protein